MNQRINLILYIFGVFFVNVSQSSNNPLRPSINSRGGYQGGNNEPTRKNGRDDLSDNQREQLYEAYNLLHSLAQVIISYIYK